MNRIKSLFTPPLFDDKLPKHPPSKNVIHRVWYWWFTPRTSDPTAIYRERGLRILLPIISLLRVLAIVNQYFTSPDLPSPFSPLWVTVVLTFIAPIALTFWLLAWRKLDLATFSFLLHWYLTDISNLPVDGYWNAGFQISLILQVVLAALLLPSQALIPYMGFQLVTFGIWGAWLDANFYDPPLLASGLPITTFTRTIFTLAAQESIILFIVRFLRTEMEKHLRLQQTTIKELQHQISERQHAEATASASEERYRLISSVISDYTFSSQFGPQGELQNILLGGAFETITGYSPTEFMAHGGWRATLHPDDVAQDEQDMARLNLNQKVVTEVRTIRKDGALRWVRVYTHPVWDTARQRLAGIYGAVQDITERKQADEALQRRTAQLEILNQIDRAILAARAPEAIALAALTRLRRLVPCARASVSLFDFLTQLAHILALDTDQPTSLPSGLDVSFETYGLEAIAALQTGQIYRFCAVKTRRFQRRDATRTAPPQANPACILQF